MHFRPDWATRMHLPWAHSDSVKLRALCFWAPVAVAAFTRGQCYSMRKVPDLLCKVPAQRVLTQPCSDLESSHSLCLLMCTEHRKQPLVPILVWTLNTPPETSAEPGCLSFSFIYCSSARSWKETCQFLLCAARWPSGDSLAADHFVQQRTEEKSTEPGPCLVRVTPLDDLLFLMQKGRAFPPFFSTPLAWL